MKTNKTKLLLGCGALALLGALALQGCSSGDDTAATGGTGGTSTGGTSTGGKGGSGAGGTSTGGKGGTGSAGTGTAGTGTAGTGTGGMSAAGSTGEGGAAGEATVAHPTTEECATFCADELTTCATLNPYATPVACSDACKGFVLGGDPATTMAGDTFACRRWHLSAAADPGPKATHCPHTGLISKNMDGSPGPCTN
ncbi:MAG TPA: hypothetical protein VNW92_30160 [Polyangiaceae bacterium]|nr:hypothetical protein [Polyangiaceae bacterium]